MHDDPADLYAGALALTNARRFAEAHAALGPAEAAASDPDLRARIVGTRAYVLTQLGRSAEGEALCHEVLARDDLSAHTRGVIAGQLGSILMHLGRLDEAHEWLGRGIDTIPDDPVAVANLRMNRSLAAMQRRDLAVAVVDLELAVAVYETHGTPVEVAEARHNLGYAALLAGDLVRAMREMGAARPVIAAAGSPANTAICDVDMAEALRDAGLVTEAERLLRDAAKVFSRHRLPQARAEAELQLAKSLLHHDPIDAARVAGQAARHFDAVAAHSWADRARGIRLRARLSGNAVDRAGRLVPDVHVDDGEALPLAARLSRTGLHADAAALRLSRSLWRVRHDRRVDRLTPVDGAAPLEVRLLAHAVRAERAVHAGDDAAARRFAARGLDELSAQRSSFGSLDLQTSLAMHGNTLMMAGLGAAVRSGRPATVFDWSERARHLSIEVVPLRPPADPEQAAELSELRMLRAEAAGEDWASDPRARELAERLRRRQWTTTGAAHLVRRVTLEETATHLAADTVLLSYVFSPVGLHVLRVTAAGADVGEIAGWNETRKALPALRSDLDMAAAVRSGPMAAVVRRSLDERLRRLSATLIDRSLADVTARRVVITAPGVLAGLPWAMLPGLHDRAVTVASSASRWVTGRASAATPLRAAGFAVGPRIARGAEEATRGAAAWAARASRVSGAGAPDGTVLDGTVLEGDAATVEAVSALAAGVDVLHVSAHGRHALDNPLFSGLQLADGALFGYDVDRMPRVPAVVVLSACEAGRSAIRWGEESVGMARAWLHAGAQVVVAAPVIVADDDACEVLGAVHEGLAAGASPAVALAEAGRRTGIRAPFLCHGNGF